MNWKKHQTAILAGVLAFLFGAAIGNANGIKEGYADGYLDGDVAGWSRGSQAAVEKVWWDGVVAGCNVVFTETGWTYLVYKDHWWDRIDQDTFCKDGGDHSGTPTFDFPYDAGN